MDGNKRGQYVESLLHRYLTRDPSVAHGGRSQADKPCCGSVDSFSRGAHYLSARIVWSIAHAEQRVLARMHVWQANVVDKLQTFIFEVVVVRSASALCGSTA